MFLSGTLGFQTAEERKTWSTVVCAQEIMPCLLVLNVNSVPSIPLMCVLSSVPQLDARLCEDDDLRLGLYNLAQVLITKIQGRCFNQDVSYFLMGTMIKYFEIRSILANPRHVSP